MGRSAPSFAFFFMQDLIQRSLKASVWGAAIAFAPLSGAVADVNSTWFDADGGRWEHGSWDDGVPNGAGDGASIFVSSPSGANREVAFALPQPLGLDRLLLVSSSSRVTFGAAADSLTMQSAIVGGRSILNVQNYAPGITDFLPRVTADRLRVESQGAVHFAGGFDVQADLDLVTRGSFSVASGIRAHSVALSAREELPTDTVNFRGPISANKQINMNFERVGSVRFHDSIEADYVSVNAALADDGRAVFSQTMTGRALVDLNISNGDVTVANVEGDHVNLVGGSGVATLGLGASVQSLQVEGRGTVRIANIADGFSGSVFGNVEGTFDVVTDLVPHEVSGLRTGTLRISGGGRFEVGEIRNSFGSPDPVRVELAGGELFVSKAAGVSLPGVIVNGGQSAIVFGEEADSTPLKVGAIDRTADSLLLVRREVSGEDARLKLSGAPTLVGTGAVGTDSVRVLSGVVFDSTASQSGTGFATYDADSGTLRALVEDEYRTSVGAGANVKLGGGLTTAMGPVSVNSLVLGGGTTLRFSGPVFDVRSGMVISTGESANVIDRLGGGQQMGSAGQRLLHFFTETDLTVNVGVPWKLVKSGEARMVYRPGGMPTRDIVVNRGTLEIDGYGQLDSLTVRSGGILRTDAPLNGRVAAAIERGGRWEVSGPDQAIDSLQGRGTIVGVGGGDPTRVEFNAPQSNPFETTELGVAFAGNLDLVLGTSNPLVLTGKSLHTGETWILSENLTLGVDEALSAESVLRLSGRLNLDGFRTSVGGLRVDSFGIIDGGSGGAMGQLTLDVGAGQAESAVVRIEGGTRLVKRGEGSQTINANLLDAHGGAEFDVREGTLVVDGGHWGERGQLRVGGEGRLEVRMDPDGFVEVVDVASGARVRRESRIFSGQDAHRYRSEAGGRTEFALLRAEAGEYLAEFGDGVAGVTLGETIDLSETGDLKFVLQIGFDSVALADSVSDLRLGWFDGGEWIEAILGNSVRRENFVGEVAWSDEFLLGDWGVDPAAGEIWAVVDHGGSFAVIAVPEVGTVGLVVVGLMAVFWMGRRKSDPLSTR